MISTDARPYVTTPADEEQEKFNALAEEWLALRHRRGYLRAEAITAAEGRLCDTIKGRMEEIAETLRAAGRFVRVSSCAGTEYAVAAPEVVR